MTITTIANTIIIVCSSLTAILAVIEKSSKIKWTPITKILHGNISSRLDTIEKRLDEKDISDIRNNIMANDMLIRNGEHLKQYQYEALFQDIKKWDKYHERYQDLNGICKIAIKNIKEAYANEKFDEES